METVLRKFGSSNRVGLVIPKALCDALKLKAGQTVQLNASDEGLLVRSVAHRHNLDELLAQCDPEAAPPSDLAEWRDAKPVGREVW